jgi:hypothetical protein
LNLRHQLNISHQAANAGLQLAAATRKTAHLANLVQTAADHLAFPVLKANKAHLAPRANQAVTALLVLKVAQALRVLRVMKDCRGHLVLMDPEAIKVELEKLVWQAPEDRLVDKVQLVCVVKTVSPVVTVRLANQVAQVPMVAMDQLAQRVLKVVLVVAVQLVTRVAVVQPVFLANPVVTTQET